MTSAQAKKDAKERLAAAGIPFQTMRAKSVSFQGFGYGVGIFVYVGGIDFQQDGTLAKWDAIKAAIPKPSQGGYILNSGNG